MDPLDQRLTDAGTAWRQSQPEPPDLDRIVAALDRRPPRAFSPRLTFVFAAGLLLLGAAAAATGAGGLFRAPDNGLPVTATSTPASTTAPTPVSSPSEPNVAARATALIDSYETALVSGQWQTAFDMLAPASPTRGAGLQAFAAERAPYYDSVAGRYTIGAPTRDEPDWSIYAPLVDGADLTQAYLVEVDYPALSGNNAGYEQFVVAPDTSGTLMIWPVR
jgi:hypothetical protein